MTWYEGYLEYTALCNTCLVIAAAILYLYFHGGNQK